MKVALLSSAENDIWRRFIARHGDALAPLGIEVGLVVLDENRRQGGRWQHARRVAARQARHAGRSWPAQLASIVAYKALTRTGRVHETLPEPHASVATVRVPTLNGRTARDAVREAGCDVACLMGTRILTRRTLEQLGVPVLNVHASDPRRVRGGPPFFWEILGGEEQVVLTVHEVVPELDAGPIVGQRSCPIVFERGLARTLAASARPAWTAAADLYRDVLADLASGRSERAPFEPGALKVTPSLREILTADRTCRRRHREREASRRRESSVSA